MVSDNRHTIRAVVIVIIIAVLSVFLSHFVFPVVRINGAALEPKWSDGDILLLLDKNKYSTGDLCCISLGNKILVRRVIGQSGDKVEITDLGDVYINGELLDEPYVSDKGPAGTDTSLSLTVPEGSIFILCDDRENRYDSRDPDIGCVSQELFIGKVLTKVWPLI